jgi:hypothetical protein
MRSEGTTLKNVESVVGFFLHDNALAHQLVFGHGFLSKEQCDNTGASPHPLLTWLQLIFTISLD